MAHRVSVESLAKLQANASYTREFRAVRSRFQPVCAGSSPCQSLSRTQPRHLQTHAHAAQETFASWHTSTMARRRAFAPFLHRSRDDAARGPPAACWTRVYLSAHVRRRRLTDCLISSNGIISQKLAGRVRYMDSTCVGESPPGRRRDVCSGCTTSLCARAPLTPTSQR